VSDQSEENYTHIHPDLEEKCINTIRFLAVDAVSESQLRASGHAHGSLCSGLRVVEPPDALQPGKSTVA
jgi:hypothetical protein